MGRVEPEPLAFLRGPLAPSFQRRVVVIPAGGTRVFDGAEWRDALVAVTGGRVEVEFLCGTRRPFGSGDLLWLDGLPVRALHNPGASPAVLVAVARTFSRPCEDGR